MPALPTHIIERAAEAVAELISVREWDQDDAPVGSSRRELLDIEIEELRRLHGRLKQASV